ncbi:hypothetical protein [Lacticaseibacillus sp. GG6-2]
MRKLWLLVVIGLSWWGTPTSAVSAVVSYDPAQGGVFWEPPAEILTYINTEEFIPFGYAAPGNLSVTTATSTSLASTWYKLNDDGTITTPESSTGYVTPNNSNLGVIARFANTGDYRVDLKLTTDKAQSSVITRTVIVHVTDPVNSRQLLPLPKQRLLSPLPTLLETTSSGGNNFLEIKKEFEPDQREHAFIWRLTKPIYYVYPLTWWDGTMINIDPQTQEFTFYLNGQPQTQTLSYGLANITAVEGHPITLDALYLKPMPGTKLTFNWTYTVKGGKAQTIASDTPSLPIPDNWHADGSIYVTLIYSYDGKSVPIKSNTVAYHYQPQVIRATSTFAVSDLLQHDIHVNARIADWPITQTGDWQLEVAVSPVQTNSGVRMPAALVLPGGTQVAGGETKRLAFSGDQVLALTQAEWLLQQQLTPVVGQYNATVRFTVISGPE